MSEVDPAAARMRTYVLSLEEMEDVLRRRASSATDALVSHGAALRDAGEHEAITRALCALLGLGADASDFAIDEVTPVRRGPRAGTLQLRGDLARRAAAQCLSQPTFAVQSTEECATAAVFAYVLRGPQSEARLMRRYRG